MAFNAPFINFHPAPKQWRAFEALQDQKINFVGYGGSAFCFVGDTLVKTNIGHIPIKYIQPGTLVLSETDTGLLEYQPVLLKHVNSRDTVRKFITFELQNGTTIKSTEQHEYRFKGDWVHARDIAKRTMEIRGEHREPLSNKQYGSIIDNWLQGEQSDFSYEASAGQVRIYENINIAEPEINYRENTQVSSECIYTKSREQSGSKPQEFYSSGQPRREFGMEYPRGEHETLRRFKTPGLERFTSPLHEGKRQSDFDTYGSQSNRNKGQIQAPGIYTANVSGRVRSKRRHNKRCSFTEELGAREITIEEIKSITFSTEYIETYDLTVNKNHNYIVSDSNIKVHNSGKSYLMCYWLTIMSCGFPGTAWGLCRKELVTLKKTTLITLFKVFQECQIKPKIHYNYNQQLNTITFWNGSVIFLIDTAYQPSDPLYARFGGFELTGAGVDESAETNIKAIEILSTRIGRVKNDEYSIAATILETFNPDKGHVYRRYYKPWKDSTTPREDGKPLPPMPEGYTFIKALPADNPSPDVAPYVARIIKTGDRVTVERLIYGNFEFDDDPQKLYNYNRILELFSNSYVMPRPDRYITADLAYEGADIFVIVVWYGLVVEEIIDIQKISEVLVANKIHEVRSKYQIPISNVLYDADGVKRFVKNAAANGTLKGAREFHNGASPIKVDGDTENYYNLKAQCAYKLAEYMEQGKIFLRGVTNDQRESIIAEFEQIKKMIRMDDKDPLRLEKKDDLRERLGRSPDYWDAIMMRMFFELKAKTGNSSWMSAVH